MPKKRKKGKNKGKIFIVALLITGMFVLIFKERLKVLAGTLQSHASAYFHDYDNANYTFGIDVSHYQEKINWQHVKVSKHPIQFVFVRATMGKDRKDTQYNRNWKETKNNGFIRGAYHYYDPNENSTLQAENFIQSVQLEKGDFPPVLDIEEMSKYGNTNLHRGLKNWLTIIEKHYGVKPILYTGYKYYRDNLKKDFSDYPLWVAAYSRSKNSIAQVNWRLHQFTDKVQVYGIKGYTDGNDFNGTLEELQALLIQ